LEVETDDFDLEEFRLCIRRFASETEIDSKIWQCKQEFDRLSLPPLRTMIIFKTWHCFLCDFPRPAHICRQIQSLWNFRLKPVEEHNTHYSPPPRLLCTIHHYSTQIANILTLITSSISDDAIAGFSHVSVKLFRHLKIVIGQIASDYSVREMLGQVTVFTDVVDRVNRFRSEYTRLNAAVSEHGICFYVNSVQVCLLKLLDFVTMIGV
jgi:hypothetical protein